MMRFSDPMSVPTLLRSHSLTRVLSYPCTDAKGRKLTIVKVPCPPAIFRTYKEAGGLLVSRGQCRRKLAVATDACTLGRCGF